MSLRRVRTISTLLCIAAAGACVAASDGEDATTTAAAERPSILTGNEHALWLVHPDSEGRYGVVVRPAGEKWEWAARYVAREKLTEPPAAGVATGPQLQLLLADPRAYQLYTIDGERTILPYPSHERWDEDARPLAMCRAEGLHGGNSGSVAAVVALPVREPTTSSTAPAGADTTTATAPADEHPTTTTAPAEPREPTHIRLGVFQSRGSQWHWLGDIATENGRVFATVADGLMYVLLAPTDGRPNRLFVSAQQEDWRELPLGETASAAHVAGMLTLTGRPRIVLTVDDEQTGKKRLLLATWRADEQMSVQPLRMDEQELTIDADRTPLASRLGDQVAVVAGIDGKYVLITSDTSGRSVLRGELDIFARQPPDTSGQAIMEYFMWGIAIAMFVPLLFLRPKSTDRIFTLPQTLRPGALTKRLAAAAIDALPFHLLGGVLMVTQVPLEQMRDVENIWTTAQEYSMTAESAYVLISVILLFIAYCVFMELRFSATLGKMALGLRVCGNNGRRPDLRGVLLRNISKVIETLWLLPIPVLLLWPLFNPYRQRIGDVLGRTAVVDARRVPPPPAQQGGEQQSESSPHEQGPQTPPPPPPDEQRDDEKRG
ncbi:MAG: RDD family protein [Phycisphaerae bacterium]